MNAYQRLVRPILFALPPETAYHFATLALKPWWIWAVIEHLTSEMPSAAVEVAGIAMGNRVGLAAGFDKNCERLPTLSRLDFGYVTCGTVTLNRREGNPKRRMVRDQPRQALINSMGFPNKGLDSAVENIARSRRHRGDTPIVASVSGTAIDDIATCHRALEPLVDAVEVNISSPNTEGLKIFHNPDTLRELICEINSERSKPLFVKIPPFPSGDEDAESHKLALSLMDACASNGVSALTIANTQPVNDNRLAIGSGGLSGKPIHDQMLRMVKEARDHVKNGVYINASGGIFAVEDAANALDEGADTVQLLTGLVYEGPYLARRIAKGLAELRADNPAASVLETVRQR